MDEADVSLLKPIEELFPIDETKPEQYLSHLVLRRVVREHHGKSIHRLIFNHVDIKHTNLIASIGDMEVEEGISFSMNHILTQFS
jgi:hypothetical protein